ncbi:zinc ribbon domain-containing protein [Halogranum rubrum]|uniref:DUF7577 domain-containing protein n=1 Tax=Halogranum salarium B-1 TaxID=1210908 RepID=J3A1M5_9EURY|nr:zinc ribbon domain-containing protein [Halogranum salarium]EJN59203.1 hypothetical protein HSB1_26240 [Halogranum salarium B-1]
MELAFRLLVAVFVVVAPSLLFVGLWRGLHALRDDHLVARMEDHARTDDQRRSPALPFVPPTGKRETTTRVSVVACGTCGTPNPDGVTFCHECLTRLG